MQLTLVNTASASDNTSGMTLTYTPATVGNILVVVVGASVGTSIELEQSPAIAPMTTVVDQNPNGGSLMVYYGIIDNVEETTFTVSGGTDIYYMMQVLEFSMSGLAVVETFSATTSTNTNVSSGTTPSLTATLPSLYIGVVWPMSATSSSFAITSPSGYEAIVTGYVQMAVIYGLNPGVSAGGVEWTVSGNESEQTNASVVIEISAPTPQPIVVNPTAVARAADW